ncbi:FKBP-type peptidyl-prolyl cis-trans isomerase [uncultured archaeon]|nr:FKBP-type peptidyl-prolyl cis-trans isomerase [uncultured archaeon]
MAIKTKDKVTLDYEGRLETGEVFDTSKHEGHSHPLTFTVGDGEVIPGFEKAVMGMEVDEEKEFSIPPEEAYGMPDERLHQEIPKSVLPTEPEPQVGMTLVMQTPQGNIPVMISEVKEESVIIDLNHPLAGKKLIFKIKVLKIN